MSILGRTNEKQNNKKLSRKLSKRKNCDNAMV